MKNFTDTKIEEIYSVALKLGVESASETEKQLFKNALRQIAVCAIDDVRSNIGELLHQESIKYTNSPTL